jgi:hypothetical protein
LLFDFLRMLDELISVKGTPLFFLFLFFACRLRASFHLLYRCFDLSRYYITIILILQLVYIFLIVAATSSQLRYPLIHNSRS